MLKREPQFQYDYLVEAEDISVLFRVNFDVFEDLDIKKHYPVSFINEDGEEIRILPEDRETFSLYKKDGKKLEKELWGYIEKQARDSSSFEPNF